MKESLGIQSYWTGYVYTCMPWTHNYDNNDYLQPTKPVYTSSEEDIFCGLGNMHKSSLLQHMYIQ